MRIRSTLAVILTAAVTALGVGVFPAGGAAAADGETFMGQAIQPLSGLFVVAKDVNVRAKPATKGKRVGRLKKGERVDAIGRAAKAKGWMAVGQKGKPLGFVYAPMLLPLIDGQLDTDLMGKVKTGGAKGARATCEYAIRFEGKVPVEGDLFDSSDYTVFFRCRGGGKELLFDGPMFLTEAPFRLGTKPEYQITLDLLQISDGYDRVFSTTSLYHKGNGSVTFDSATMKNLAKAPKPKQRVAETVPDALKAAVELAVKSWNDKLWQVLADPKKMPKAAKGKK